MKNMWCFYSNTFFLKFSHLNGIHHLLNVNVCIPPSPPSPPVPVNRHYKQIQTVHVAKYDVCTAQCALEECARDLVFSLGEFTTDGQMGKYFLGD